MFSIHIGADVDDDNYSMNTLARFGSIYAVRVFNWTSERQMIWHYGEWIPGSRWIV